MSYDSVKSIVALLALLISFGVFGWRCYQFLWVNLRRGQPSGAFRQWGERIKGLIIFVAAQFRLFRFQVCFGRIHLGLPLPIHTLSYRSSENSDR